MLRCPALTPPGVTTLLPGDTDPPGHIEHQGAHLGPEHRPQSHLEWTVLILLIVIIVPHPIQRPLVDADPGHGDVCVSDGDLEGHVRGEDSPIMVTRHLV